MTYLALKWTSKASAHQRSGRAGRTMEGIAVRLQPGRVNVRGRKDGRVIYGVLFFADDQRKMGSQVLSLDLHRSSSSGFHVAVL